MKRTPYQGRLAPLKLIPAVALLSILWSGAVGVNGAGPSVLGCTELLQNGGFEAGAAGWQEYSVQGYSLISDFSPRTGQLGAYLAGVNDADDRISQPVTLPAGAASITLRAWWYLATAETAGAFDTLTIWLLRPDNTPLIRLLRVDNTSPVGIWDEIVIDLTAYAGQAVVLQFVGQTDLSNISDFFIDDVSVNACSATATATATSSPTPTATGTGGMAPATATATATSTLTPTATATSTSTPTATGGMTPATATATATSTLTPTAIATSTPTPTATGRGTLRTFLPLVVKG